MPKPKCPLGSNQAKQVTENKLASRRKSTARHESAQGGPDPAVISPRKYEHKDTSGWSEGVGSRRWSWHRAALHVCTDAAIASDSNHQQWWATEHCSGAAPSPRESLNSEPESGRTSPQCPSHGKAPRGSAAGASGGHRASCAMASPPGSWSVGQLEVRDGFN